MRGPLWAGEHWGQGHDGKATMAMNRAAVGSFNSLYAGGSWEDRASSIEVQSQLDPAKPHSASLYTHPLHHAAPYTPFQPPRQNQIIV